MWCCVCVIGVLCVGLYVVVFFVFVVWLVLIDFVVCVRFCSLCVHALGTINCVFFFCV